MVITTPELFSFCALLISLSALLDKKSSSTNEFQRNIIDRVSKLEGSLSIVLGTLLQAGKVVHSPHTPEADKLIEKMTSGERLSEDELKQLRVLLEQEQPVDNGKWVGKIMLMGGIDMLLHQQENAHKQERRLSWLYAWIQKLVR